ncbi:hypothetical protein EDC94DRAFT_616796 [Helicostylum pulchrum]|nr:hypothetical protein EDC94DRAFT_616796 [Helicostylum pulchrum]
MYRPVITLPCSSKLIINILNRLDIHVHKSFYLNPKNIERYSEEDFKLKFRSHIIEEFFSISSFFLHWGDTVPETFSSSSSKPKVDLRISSLVSSKQPD